MWCTLEVFGVLPTRPLSPRLQPKVTISGLPKSNQRTFTLETDTASDLVRNFWAVCGESRQLLNCLLTMPNLDIPERLPPGQSCTIQFSRSN